MKTILWILVILLVLAGGTAVYLFSQYNSKLEPVNPAATETFKLVEIPQGYGSEAIGKLLCDEGLIQNELAFRIFLRQSGLGQGFKAGRYNLSPSMSIEEIAQKLERGEVYSETSWFTIPEGYSIIDIATRLSDSSLVDHDTFLQMAQNPPADLVADYPFLGQVNNPEIDYLLEGYLFPDTYEVYSDAGEEAIIRLMLNRMLQVIDEQEQARIADMGWTVHDILTLASIVEREARVDHERPLIAGVFMNRLQIGQRLESCATIQYILGETKEFLTNQDLQLPSPYNTYQHAGLPPGPIAAPGEASVMAVLYPEHSDYYFFNYKYDGTGEHYFSITLEEHNANVARAEANLE